MDSSYRDRARLIQADNRKGGIVAHMFGATEFQKRLRDTRQKEIVQPRRQELKKLRENLAREEREVLRRYKEGRPESFKEYGISSGEYDRDPAKAIEKLKKNLSKRRRDMVRDVEKKYEQQWKSTRRGIYNAREEASQSGPGVA